MGDVPGLEAELRSHFRFVFISCGPYSSYSTRAFLSGYDKKDNMCVKKELVVISSNIIREPG